MSTRFKILYSSTLLLVLLMIFIPNNLGFGNDTKSCASNEIAGLFQENEPISINGDSDFHQQAILNNWTGNGSSTSPYIIKSLNITSSSSEITLCTIKHTTVYFVLENCHLIGGVTGINLENLTNGVILNNSISKTTLGLRIAHARDTLIQYNEIHGSTAGVYCYTITDCKILNNTINTIVNRGLLIDYSQFCNISGNQIFDTSEGVKLRDSPRNHITWNLISNNSENGLILANAGNSNVTDNFICGNGLSGIELQDSGHCVIMKNVISKNGFYGLALYGEQNSILNNTLYFNAFHAVYIDGNNCIIVDNNFIDNFWPVMFSQILNKYTGSVLDKNYYSDLTKPDSDQDGIVDVPYMAAEVNVFDIHPRTKPIIDNKIHVLSRPRFYLPIDAASEVNIYDLDFNISWGVVGDTLGHSISYDLFYSYSNSSDWIEIVTGVSETVHLWDLSSIPNGKNYSFKVVATCGYGLQSIGISVPINIRKHVLSPPELIAPNGNEALQYEFLIRWNPSNDSLNHEIFYDLYYSDDGGGTWYQIAENCDGSSFLWHLANLTPGNDYLIKVVAHCEWDSNSEDISDATFTILYIIPDWVLPITVLSSLVCVIVMIFVLRRRRMVR